MTDHPEIGVLHGVTRDITTSTGIITPDVSAKASNGSAAIFFELKWTLTPSTVSDEILKMKSYCEAIFKWEGEIVRPVDVVFVVNEEDAAIAKASADSLLSSGNDFLKSGFTIWKWHFSPGRALGGEPSIWFEKIWGVTVDKNLDGLVSTPSGYQTPPEVLRYLRWSYRFIKDKPPIQYTIGMLLMHVFSSFRTRTDQSESLHVDLSLTDAIYERAKGFFPAVAPSSETIQARKRWIREALKTMIDVSLAKVRVPTATRIPLQEMICRKIQGRAIRVGGRPPPRRIRRPKPSPFDTKLV